MLHQSPADQYPQRFSVVRDHVVSSLRVCQHNKISLCSVHRLKTLIYLNLMHDFLISPDSHLQVEFALIVVLMQYSRARFNIQLMVEHFVTCNRCWGFMLELYDWSSHCMLYNTTPASGSGSVCIIYCGGCLQCNVFHLFTTYMHGNVIFFEIFVANNTEMNP